MAVINSPWVGDARGKLAGGVYFRAKGQTLARGYNPSPLNRRTSPQQAQRALFSSAVRFYTKGVQNLFKFAFEGKATKESDYNAFMRYNAKLGMYFGPAENKNEAFGSLAPWVLSRGSLVDKYVYWDNESPFFNIQFYTTAVPPSSPTVGWLSGVILQEEGFMSGDILTFLRINSYEQPGSRSYPYSNVPSTMPFWEINQFALDTSDTRTLASMGIEVDSRGSTLCVWMGNPGYEGMAEGAACIHSRISNGQLFVSDSDLRLNDMGETVYYFGRTDTWRDIVLAAWNSEDKSILQGSRLRAKSQGSGVDLLYSFQLPIPSANLTERNLYVMGVTDIDDIAQYLRFYTSTGRTEDSCSLDRNTETNKLELKDSTDTFGTADYEVLGDYIAIYFNQVSAGPTFTRIVWESE